MMVDNTEIYTNTSKSSTNIMYTILQLQIKVRTSYV